MIQKVERYAIVSSLFYVDRQSSAELAEVVQNMEPDNAQVFLLLKITVATEETIVRHDLVPCEQKEKQICSRSVPVLTF